VGWFRFSGRSELPIYQPCVYVIANVIKKHCQRIYVALRTRPAGSQCEAASNNCQGFTRVFRDEQINPRFINSSATRTRLPCLCTIISRFQSKTISPIHKTRPSLLRTSANDLSARAVWRSRWNCYVITACMFQLIRPRCTKRTNADTRNRPTLTTCLLVVLPLLFLKMKSEKGSDFALSRWRE